MNKRTAFINLPREEPPKRPVEERVRDNRDVYLPLAEETIQAQASRCMDCGVPFCQAGCPLGNIIPDWNELVYRNRWREAYDRLRATNNFPEFTGRICPAPCESACVLGLVAEPVTIERIEQAVVEHAFREGWVQPQPPARRTGKQVAVVGSGPAGLACADQLNRAGHRVTVFERDDHPGGLLRYGIPDFKLEKWVIDRRLALMEAEGIRFVTGVEVGDAYTVAQLRDGFEAVVLCTGATAPRPLPVPGHELDGIHYAWDYLWQQNRRVAGDDLRGPTAPAIDAAGKHVVVIGGGDTASDCIGVANRQGAASITNFHIWPEPPKERSSETPWPFVPHTLHVSSSHEEGCNRVWAVSTKAYMGKEGRITHVRTLDVEASQDADGRWRRRERPDTDRIWPTDLVLIAIGYEGPEPEGLLDRLRIDLDPRGNVATDERYRTSVEGVFAAGDNRRGQSLVVWAIAEGREAARNVDIYLTGHTDLPTKGAGDLES